MKSRLAFVPSGAGSSILVEVDGLQHALGAEPRGRRLQHVDDVPGDVPAGFLRRHQSGPVGRVLDIGEADARLRGIGLLVAFDLAELIGPAPGAEIDHLVRRPRDPARGQQAERGERDQPRGPRPQRHEIAPIDRQHSLFHFPPASAHCSLPLFPSHCNNDMNRPASHRAPYARQNGVSQPISTVPPALSPCASPVFGTRAISSPRPAAEITARK